MKPCILIYGNQPLANRQKEDEILSLYQSKQTILADQIDIFDCEDLVYKLVSPSTWLKNLKTACENLSFLTENKLIVIRNIEKIPSVFAEAKIERTLADISFDIQKENQTPTLFLSNSIKSKEKISALSLLSHFQLVNTSTMAIEYKRAWQNARLYQDAQQETSIPILNFLSTKLKKTVVLSSENQNIEIQSADNWALQLTHELVNYLQDPPDNTSFVLTANIRKIEELPKALQKAIKAHAELHKTLITYDDFNPRTWLRKEANTLGLTFDSQAESLFISLVGNNLSLLHSELSKLDLFCENKTVTTNDIWQVVSNPFQNEIFKLTKALVARNLQLSLTIVNNLLQANIKEAVSIHGLLASQFRKFLHIQWMKEQRIAQQDIVFFLKVPPFIANQIIEQASHFTTKELIAILCYLAKQDLPIKYAQKQADLIVSDFILQICTHTFS